MPGLSIRSLLVGLFALMALIVGGEGMLAINKIAAVNASVTDLANNWLPSVDVVRRINAIAEQYRVYQARHVMAASDAEMAAQEAAIAKTAEALDAARKRYESLISSDEERRSYTLFGSHLALYQQSVPELIKLSRANRKADASALYIGELSRKFTEVRNELGKLVELNDKGAREATVAAAANYEAARALTFMTLGAGIAIAIGAMAFSFFGIARPIGRITQAMGVLAERRHRGGHSVRGAARRDRPDGGGGAGVQGQHDQGARARSRGRSREGARRRAAQGGHAQARRRFPGRGRRHRPDRLVGLDAARGRRRHADQDRRSHAAAVRHGRGRLRAGLGQRAVGRLGDRGDDLVGERDQPPGAGVEPHRQRGREAGAADRRRASTNCRRPPAASATS